MIITILGIVLTPTIIYLILYVDICVDIDIILTFVLIFILISDLKIVFYYHHSFKSITI